MKASKMILFLHGIFYFCTENHLFKSHLLILHLDDLYCLQKVFFKVVACVVLNYDAVKKEDAYHFQHIQLAQNDLGHNRFSSQNTIFIIFFNFY